MYVTHEVNVFIYLFYKIIMLFTPPSESIHIAKQRGGILLRNCRILHGCCLFASN